MIKYITGNLLESEADCLINTVNCEGYMGKGITLSVEELKKLREILNNMDL